MNDITQRDDNATDRMGDWYPGCPLTRVEHKRAAEEGLNPAQAVARHIDEILANWTLAC